MKEEIVAALSCAVCCFLLLLPLNSSWILANLLLFGYPLLLFAAFPDEALSTEQKLVYWPLFSFLTLLDYLQNVPGFYLAKVVIMVASLDYPKGLGIVVAPVAPLPPQESVAGNNKANNSKLSRLSQLITEKSSSLRSPELEAARQLVFDEESIIEEMIVESSHLSSSRLITPLSGGVETFTDALSERSIQSNTL